MHMPSPEDSGMSGLSCRWDVWWVNASADVLKKLGCLRTCHLALTASWLTSVSRWLRERSTLHPNSASNHFIGNAVHNKFSSCCKPYEQSGHKKAHSPRCCLWLRNRGKSAQNHHGRAQFWHNQRKELLFSSVHVHVFYGITKSFHKWILRKQE